MKSLYESILASTNSGMQFVIKNLLYSTKITQAGVNKLNKAWISIGLGLKDCEWYKYINECYEYKSKSGQTIIIGPTKTKKFPTIRCEVPLFYSNNIITQEEYQMWRTKVCEKLKARTSVYDKSFEKLDF